MQGHLRQLRRTEDVAGRHGVDRVKSHRRKHIPGRHLTAVVVAAKAFGLRQILSLDDFAHQFLRALRLAGKGIEISHVVARLIAVGILANQARHVAKRAVELGGEKRVELRDEGLAAAEELDKARHVVLHVPRVLPGVALRVIAAVAFCMGEGGGVERRLPFARAEARTHEISALVEEVLVEIGAAGEIFIVVLFAHLQRHVGGGVVVVNILERARNRLHLDDVAREVAVFHISLPIRLHLVRLRLRHLDGLERALRVEVAEALVVSLGNDGHAVVGNHAVVFLAPKRPYRQVSLRFGLADHRAHEGTYHFRHGQRVERVRGAVGVPGGEGGVERAVFGFRQIAVGVAVRAVNVGNVVGLDKGMIEAGVEICLFHVRAFHLDAV